MSEDAAATLAAIRQRYANTRAPITGNSVTVLFASASDVPLLLAAIEAVLKLHQPGPVAILGILCKRHENHRFFSITSTEADDVRACQDCAAKVYTSCTGCATGVSVDMCPVREAIRAALAGKEAQGG